MSGSGTLILLFLFLVPVFAHLSDILKTCRDVSCDPEEGDPSSLNPDNSFEWMAAGLPLIFWQAVKTQSIFNHATISSECKSQLVSISKGMQQTKEWAYEFMDASGKTPAGVLRATITAIGEYDQCLDIDSHGIQGKYCMMDMHHLKRSNMAPDTLALDRVNTFEGYPFLSALCLPSACHEVEIKRSMKQLLQPYGIRVAGDINCDTRNNTSWTYRLSRLTVKQVISILFISIILSSVVTATWIDLYHRYVLNREQDPGLVSSLSFLSTSHKLFYAKPWKSFEIQVFDGMRCAMIYFASLSHLMTCAEAPLSYATISNHRFLNFLLDSPYTQFMLNDAALLSLPFYSGLATFAILFPMAKKAKVPYMAAVIDRFVRFLPPILVLTACEFIWPIIGNGPLYTRVADFNLFKCEKNWLYNVFFVNNYFLNSIDICGGHSFYSSIDMQLFLLGLIGIFIFSRNERAGIIFSITMAVCGSLKVAHSAIKYDTSFALFVKDPVPHKIVEYFHYIHMQTSSYMTAYFVGFLFTYARMKGYFYPEIRTMKQHILFLAITGLCAISMHINASMRNIFHIYPDHLNWFFISFNRTSQLLATILYYVYLTSFKSHFNKPETLQTNGQVSAVITTPPAANDQMSFSLFKTLCRLSFPMYICNYLYIRTEFFTRRFLEPVGMFWLLKRLSSSIYFVYIFTILFHLLLLAPLDAVREHLMRPTAKPEERAHKE